ncbi:uncharacterized protein PITG_04374 [Phytophthora infestans T30-4]|uniref:Retrotransposon gag domain-containing protein n=1 Tax=Phytophthora infestans (strain T30-4) TaxID=403677 RepID=D0N144_PHYIT|nr:uncharacterized protein PITG_04374 [Phytophthora infestans T30-4]EEY67357.1 conserved hypothetical protein [Phytophthora infestans T30-4]|eukprot:XP_002906005.1 conserved hypothetical protein [Phytophthora infestans T30-4]
MSSVTDVLRGLYADELKETEEGARGRTEADVDIKTEVKEEPEMKREVVAGVSARSEGLHDGWIRQRVLRRSRGVRFGLSQLVSNAMQVLPVSYSDTATVEKARGFWELFEVHTEGLPDRSKLLVLRQRLKGQEAERWWGNSSIRTLSMRKDRFHNQFLRRTADEVWDRLEATRREKGESVEEWGDLVSDLCESSDYPNPQMRYQLLYRGLRNKRMLATLDASPASDIPKACE